jgi:hypothetical protein
MPNPRHSSRRTCLLAVRQPVPSDAITRPPGSRRYRTRGLRLSETRETRTAQINLRITPTMKRTIEQMAAAERRSVINFIEGLVLAHAQEGVALVVR